LGKYGLTQLQFAFWQSFCGPSSAYLLLYMPLIRKPALSRTGAFYFFTKNKGGFMATKDLTRRGESLPSIFNDFFKPWDRWFDTNGGSWPNMMTVPAVNIVERPDHFEISLAAPGMKKDDFNIDVEGNMLTISAESEQRKDEKDERRTRQEFNYTSFSRAFTLPDGVVKDKIDASYENGLLKLNLPKTDEARKMASKHINVK
jgi:HSP20 family protein